MRDLSEIMWSNGACLRKQRTVGHALVDLNVAEDYADTVSTSRRVEFGARRHADTSHCEDRPRRDPDLGERSRRRQLAQG